MEKSTNTTEADKKIAKKNKTGAFAIGTLVLTGAAAVATGGGEGIGDNIPSNVVDPIGANLYEGIDAEEYTPLSADPTKLKMDITPDIDPGGVGGVDIGGTHERLGDQVELNDGKLDE